MIMNEFIESCVPWYPVPQWRIGHEGRGQSAPDTFTGKFLLTYREKIGKGKTGNGRRKEEKL